MSTLVRPLHHDDLAGINVREPGQLPDEFFTAGYPRVLEGQANSWTVLEGDKILMCAGTVPLWPGRNQAWAFVSESATGRGPALTRIGRWVLGQASGRTETAVRADFREGNRWVKLLGFHIENPPGVLKHFGLEGEDYISYVRFVT